MFTTMRLLSLLAAIWIAASDASAQSVDSTLKGLRKVTVDVSVTGKDVPSSITEDRIRTITELRLRTAGLTVLSNAEDRLDPDVNPRVEITILMLSVEHRGGVGVGYAFASRLAVREYRTAPRNKAIAALELWGKSFLNLTNRENAVEDVERVVNNLLDQMLNEWLRANPKR